MLYYFRMALESLPLMVEPKRVELLCMMSWTMTEESDTLL